MKVNFLIIGAGRSGTTSLYHHLKNHPQIKFSRLKELHYFSIEDLYNRGEKYYHRFFHPPENDKIMASADTYLLISKDAPKRIQHYNPSMKFIAILRDPLDRAISSFKYALSHGYESSKNSLYNTFLNENQTLKEANIIQQNNLGHFYSGLYFNHLSYWTSHFPASQFLILTTEELNRNPLTTMHKIYDFLNISPHKENIHFKKHNQAIKTKSVRLQNILSNRDHIIRKLIRFLFPDWLKHQIIHSEIINKINRLNIKKNNNSHITMSSDEKEKIQRYFSKDLNQLKNHFGITFNTHNDL